LTLIRTRRRREANIDYTALTAFATLAAVLVALFNEPLRRWFYAPSVSISWRDRDTTQETFDNGILHHFRVLITNSGRDAAHLVEVTVTAVYCRRPDNKFALLPQYLPAALKWTHTDSLRCDYLSNGDHRLCDLGTFASLFVGEPNRSFKFSADYDNDLEPGVYAVRLVAIGRNCGPASILLLVSIGEQELLDGQDLGMYSVVRAPPDAERNLV
jgi:hypothetical protein